MRTLLVARLNSDPKNAAAATAGMPDAIRAAVERWNPEAVYFTPTDGDRSCLMVFDMDDASQMPVVAEPFFAMGAKVSMQPVMNLEDLLKGLAILG
jgi:hypothetical protein